MIVSFRLKLKESAIFFAIFCLLFVLNYNIANNLSVASLANESCKLCVVLDAGHGGIDGGCQGKITKVYERDITLKICQELEIFLKSAGVKVVQTRTNADGLYGAFTSGFKLRDLNKRKQIIENIKPNLVVSVHLNSFSDSSVFGAQAYYKPGDNASHEFADKMQQLFAKNLNSKNTLSKEGDFFILNCTQCPSVLIECGFLSNEKEEALLITQQYQQKVAYQIFCGIMAFFDY